MLFRGPLFFLVICLLASGCKVSYSLSGASVPSDLHSITIIPYQNVAPLAPPSLGPTFTESTRNFFAAQTNLKLLPKGGDALLECRIVGYTVAPVAVQAAPTGGQNVAASSRLTVSVNVKFTNTLQEKQNFEQAFSMFADFPSDRSLSAVEADLLKDIQQKINTDIFNRCFSNW